MERNVPKLRFKGFNDEWNKMNLGNLFEFKNGLNKEKEYFGKGTPIVNYVDVYKKNELKSDNILGLVEVTEKEKENYSVKKGDVFFTRTSETIQEIGYTAVVTEDVKDTVFSGFVLRARPKVEQLSDKFCKYCFLTHSARKEIITKSSYTTRALTSGSLLSGMDIYLPNNIEEQERIANFLTKVDKSIEKQEEKVSNLEKYKKGMMQKIFSQEIRFKKDDGGGYPEWENKKLNDIASKITEKNKDFRVENIISNSAKNGLVSQRDLFDKDIANKDNIDGYYVIQPGDFVYNPRKSNEAPYGPINSYRLNEEGVVSPLYFCFRIDGNVNKTYIEYYFKSTKWHRYVHMNSDQGVRHDRVSIKDSEIMGMNIEIPSDSEQNKIANFLSEIDLVVEKEKKKLEELGNWKKGLLQQMFV